MIKMINLSNVKCEFEIYLILMFLHLKIQWWLHRDMTMICRSCRYTQMDVSKSKFHQQRYWSSATTKYMTKY